VEIRRNDWAAPEPVTGWNFASLTLWSANALASALAFASKNVFEVATAFGEKGGSDTLGRWTNLGPRLGLHQRASPGDGFFSELFLANKV
jgi:hypothetical protein